MEHNSVSSLLRSTQAFCMQLCEKETLDYGIAFFSPDFAALPEANQFREVWIEDPIEIPVAFEQAEHWFAHHNLFCHRWAPAQGAASQQLEGFLDARGFNKRSFRAMVLREWVEIEPAQQVRILPARAMRAAFRDTYLLDETAGAGPVRKLLADAYDQRLNDPQFDMFVAVIDHKPVGRAALYQVGDVARVVDLAVLKGFESHRVEDALLAHLIAMAKRLQFRHVLAQIEHEDKPRYSWLRRAGFVVDGEITEFERPAPEEFSA
jgi:N-acetylglutamate synthase-like GNAT family acetyltransferase